MTYSLFVGKTARTQRSYLFLCQSVLVTGSQMSYCRRSGPVRRPRGVSDRLSGPLNMHEPHAKRKDARAHPVFGSAQDLRRSQAETYARITREHGYVVRLRSDLFRKRTSGETCQLFFQVNPCNPGSL